MENSRNFSENTVGNNAIINQGNGNHITVNADTSNADTSFLQQISKTDPVYDKKRILMLKGPLLKESFSWILEHEDFNKWRHTKESGCLWIKGDPGKGKTMLLCGVIEDFERNSESENLSYFFCQAADYRINTAAAVVGGLIKSLLKRHPTLLSRTRKSHEDGEKGQLDGANALVILCDIFETITNDPGLTNVICVVDALDECVKDCRHLLNLIIRTSDRVRWLLSSRNEKDIEKGLNQVPQRLVLELKQNAEQISISIDAYIRHHIQRIDALKSDDQLQEKILDLLKAKAQGTFLWVALVVEQLHKTDHWDVENVLEEMPKDLESLYGLILDRAETLGKRSQEICQVLLSIITTAKRPLHLEELLVFINSHWKGSRHFKTTYGLQDVRDMTKTCGSVLSIREDTVYFIHQSAKDYVVENAARRIFPILHQHYKIFEASIDAMSNILEYDIYDLKDPGIHIDDVPLKNPDSDPLASIRYCCVFWIEHLVSSYQFEGFKHSKYFKDDARLHSFLKEKFLCWIESLALMRSLYPQARIALQKLSDLIDSYCGSASIGSETSQTTKLQRESETQGIRQFTADAYRFVDIFKESVPYWPLQLYFSTMSFGQDNCTIQKTFERTVREKFGPPPILVNVRRGQSLRLLSSFYVPENPSRHIDTSHFPKPLIFSHDSSLIGRMGVNESTSVLEFWRADSGTSECSFQISLDSKVTFFPNSDEFISVSLDGILKRWSMGKKSCIGEQSLDFSYASYYPNFFSRTTSMRTLSSPGETVIALSPKGDLVASWHCKTYDGVGSINIWDTETVCCRSSFGTHEAPYPHAAFSPNSQLLAVPFGSGVRVHNAKTGAKIKSLITHPDRTHETWFNLDATVEPENVWFTPNSKVLITMVSNWHLRLWDTHKWEQLHNVRSSKHSQPLEYLAISPDSAILATKSPHETKFWSIDTGECVAKVPVYALSMSFDPDWTRSSLVALQQQENTIQTWFIDISQVEAESRRADYVFDNVIISPDSKFVVSRHRHHNSVYVWSGVDGALVHVMKGRLLEHRTPSDLMIFSPDSKLLASAGSSSLYHGSGILYPGIQVWSVMTGKSVRLFGCQKESAFSSAAFSSDGKYLVAGNIDDLVKKLGPIFRAEKI
ncbi:hypothetical protein CFAM422_004130 [Trichoderma lentiforme]|uniref:Nephrocystin 3-like N-terminal domain-containing protein n=1 Tax=Trichoderma lentiforme TaxID=1567552 RepID=A0A9P4XIK9_9HYPO|nr:hypothetical protein CFAM422_004130 [Trichoderma lentiforme]